MPVVTSRPPPKDVRIGHGNKRYYTLHCVRHVFTIQKDGTAVLAFRNKADATRFGKLLESHYEVSRTWPHVNFEESLFLKTPRDGDSKLKYLVVKSWKDDSLKSFCIEHYFSMLDILRIEGECRLVGKPIQWDVPMNMYIDMLNEKVNN